MSDKPKCELCEEMFKYHGYSCVCPKPPLPRPPTEIERLAAEVASLKEQIIRARRTK